MFTNLCWDVLMTSCGDCSVVWGRWGSLQTLPGFRFNWWKAAPADVGQHRRNKSCSIIWATIFFGCLGPLWNWLLMPPQPTQGMARPCGCSSGLHGCTWVNVPSVVAPKCLICETLCCKSRRACLSGPGHAPAFTKGLREGLRTYTCTGKV